MALNLPLQVVLSPKNVSVDFFLLISTWGFPHCQKPQMRYFQHVALRFLYHSGETKRVSCRFIFLFSFYFSLSLSGCNRYS